MQENVALNNTLKDQKTSTLALAKFTDNLSVARSILNDENATSVLAGAMLSGTLEDQKKKTQELTKAYLDNMAVDRQRKDEREVTIDDANVRIETLQAENNIYQNGIDIISKRAEKVSEVYDRQIDALNKIKSVNDEINRQKQGELDIADALSRGDIGAAAKAIQQLRAQQAQDMADRQIKALEDAKKRAIESITVEINGQMFTRSELENKIYDIEIDILEIKKDQIVQNEHLLAQSKEELNNIIAQIAKLKDLKAAKDKLVENKPAGGGSPTSGDGSGGDGGEEEVEEAVIVPGSVNDPNAYKEGQPAPYGTYWHWDGKKWTNVTKNPVTTTPQTTQTGQPGTSSLATALTAADSGTVPLSSTYGANASQKSQLAEISNSKLEENRNAFVSQYDKQLSSFTSKYGSTFTEADAQKGGKIKNLQQFSKDLKALMSMRQQAKDWGLQFSYDDMQSVLSYGYERDGDGNAAVNSVAGSKTGKSLIDSTAGRLLPTLPQAVQEAIAVLKDRNNVWKQLDGSMVQAEAKWTKIRDQYGFPTSGAGSTWAEIEKSGRIGSDGKPLSDTIKPVYLAFSKARQAMIDKYNYIKGVRGFLKKSGYTSDQLATLIDSKWYNQPQWDGKTAFAIDRFATGGYVSGPGTPTSDSIPAMLSDGEFVVKASTVDKVGVNALNHLNKTGTVGKFADGGLVSGKKKPGLFDGIGSFLGDAAKNTGNFLGTAGKAIGDATPGALQFIKDYIFDWTNPLDYAALLIPGGKAILTAAKLTMKFSKFAEKGLKVASYAEKARKLAIYAKSPIKKGVEFAQKKTVSLAKDKFAQHLAPKFAGSKLGSYGGKVAAAGSKVKSKYGDLALKNLKYDDFGSDARNNALLFARKYAGERVSKLVEKGVFGLVNNPDTATGQFIKAGEQKANELKGVAAKVGMSNNLDSILRLTKFHKGGLVPGNYEMPIMAKGGEFVMSDYAVKQYGTDTMKAMNSGNATVTGDSVYNYSVNVNVANTGANPNDIARTVIAQIKQIDGQRIRSNNL
jgi:hypothetical protein